MLSIALLALQAVTTIAQCEGDTIAMNACVAGLQARAEARLQSYLQAATEMHKEEDATGAALVLGIAASQAAFEAYRRIECDTVYERFKEGSIRNFMASECALKLTNERTRVVWNNWIRHMDSTAPKLPEPKPIG